jgi:hypothetical protein
MPIITNKAIKLYLPALPNSLLSLLSFIPSGCSQIILVTGCSYNLSILVKINRRSAASLRAIKFTESLSVFPQKRLLELDSSQLTSS